MLKNAFAIVLIALAPALEAQVRVVESSPQGFRSGVAQPQNSAPIESDVYSQIRGLQDEVTSLRGLLEEQAYELKQLKQLQLDNYIELDRRLSGGASANNMPAASDSAKSTKKSRSANVDAELPVPNALSEGDAYRAAYDFLNQKDFDGAVVAFKAHLQQFPNGEFASNSHYWLGKVAMLKKDYPQAKSWFSDLINNFPRASKVPDTKLDLGKVYFIMGDKAKAKAMLSEVAAGNTDAARLAERFLQDNF
jgi:tol-pal system protein YbgF